MKVKTLSESVNKALAVRKSMRLAKVNQKEWNKRVSISIKKHPS